MAPVDPENAAPQKPEHSLGALRKSRNPATAGIAAFFDGLSVSESPPPDFRMWAYSFRLICLICPGSRGRRNTFLFERV